MELRFWIPIFSRIPDSSSCIPDSKAQDSWFHKQIFKFSRIRDSTSNISRIQEVLIPLRGTKVKLQSFETFS